jgi:stearoyl-CoA desaturase (delta-9 desaturase)
LAHTNAAGYDSGPFPSQERPQVGAPRLAITLLIVLLPVAALVAVCTALLGSGVSTVDLSLLVGFYLFTGIGITAGFHRLFTHRSFTANRALRLTLVLAGSMAFEGGVLSWVAAHRRHHAFTDAPGDPHSPYEFGTGPLQQMRGALHAHVGWLFRVDPTSIAQYAPDQHADPLMRAADRAFPLCSVVSLGLPTLIGFAATGTLAGSLNALMWGGLIRVFLLHHVTWSVNSLCHLVGTRPFRTRRADRSTNLWPLALISFGDSWHNLHHADPSCARHGVDRHQIDVAARFIRLCEQAGWATKVHWPTPQRLASHRI